MVEIFKTNVPEKEVANKIILKLLEYFPSHKINFDLEDRDRILRIDGSMIDPKQIILSLRREGYICEVLE